jgi:hypothetical protein
MRAALTLKQQDTTVPLPITIRQQPLQVLHPDTNANPKPPRSNNDQNQPPAPTVKRTMSVARRTLTKRTVPTTFKWHTQQTRDRVLANGIPKFPVWARDKKQAQPKKQVQPNSRGGNTNHDYIHIHT